jgi:hypothetical protein
VKVTRLLRRALKERWPIPASLRSGLLKRCQKVVDDPNASPREITTVMKVVLEASRVNIDAIAVELQVVRNRESQEPQPSRPEIWVPDFDARYRPARRPEGGDDDDQDEG